MDAIASVFSEVHHFRLDPAQFLVAWHGVLVLAFQGFPSRIESLKNQLMEKFQLHVQNPGSKWPKVTLAALSKQRNLTESDFQTLKKILSNNEGRLRNLSVIFDAVSLVQFNCRSLENIRNRTDIALVPVLMEDSISAEQKRTVSNILAEFESPDYFSLASLPGRDISYYRADHSEWTLVAFLNNALNKEIDHMREDIDRALPGLFEWIRPDSRHVTLLSLDQVLS